jgi:phosphoglycolate phosphatase-like HAD superfamily hydrolase
MAAPERAQRLEKARRTLLAAGADLVIESVADLIPALKSAGRF